MKQVQIFKVLTYLLIPVALLFGFMALLVLPTALANPALLLVVFIFSCITIYTFSSLRFVITGINKAKNCNPSLKDWIKVNGYISVGTALMFLLNSIGILMLRPIEFNDFVAKAMETQSNLPAAITPAFIGQMLKYTAIFMLITSTLLLVQTRIQFIFLKAYSYVFESE
jgi:hypothetical protein